MNSRPFASATIAFGPVLIPVKLHPTVGETKSPFVRAHAKCGTKAAQVFECPACNERVGAEGFGRFVASGGGLLPLLPEDLAELETEPTHRIATYVVVPLATVPRYGATASYFLAPDAGADRPFALLARALWIEKAALVVRWDGRGGEQQAVLYPAGSVLVLEVRAWSADLRQIDDVPTHGETIGPYDTDYRALKAALMVWAADRYDPTAYYDTRRATAERVVDRVVERELIAGPEGLKATLKASVRVAADRKVATPKKKARAPRKAAAHA